MRLQPENCGEVAYSTLLLISNLQLIFNPIVYAYMNNGLGDEIRFFSPRVPVKISIVFLRQRNIEELNRNCSKGTLIVRLFRQNKSSHLSMLCFYESLHSSSPNKGRIGEKTAMQIKFSAPKFFAILKRHNSYPQ